MRGVELVNVDVYGEIANLTINDVDIGSLINAELDLRHSDPVKMRPTTPADYRDAWDIVERLWDGTVPWGRVWMPRCCTIPLIARVVPRNLTPRKSSGSRHWSTSHLAPSSWTT